MVNLKFFRETLRYEVYNEMNFERLEAPVSIALEEFVIKLDYCK